MTLAEDLEDKEEKLVHQLYAVTGDKEPPGYNWLSDMEEGTIFICRPFKVKGPFMEEYHVAAQGLRFTKLYTNLNQEQLFVVDPLKFCAIMEHVETIFPKTNKEEERE